MNTINIILISILAVSLIIILYFAFRGEHPIKNILLNILITWLLWAVLNNTAFLTGVSIPLNWYTFIGCSAYGIPGMAGLIILCTIFGL